MCRASWSVRETTDSASSRLTAPRASATRATSPPSIRHEHPLTRLVSSPIGAGSRESRRRSHKVRPSLPVSTHAAPAPEEAAGAHAKWRRNITLAALAVVLAGGVAVGVVIATRGGGPASPTLVARAAGAATCDNSGFYIQSKLTSEKDVIYDCRFGRALPKCVTYSGNIASDATEQVSLLFAGSLNSSKPACLAWHAQAIHLRQVRAAHRAAVRAAARARAYAAALRRAAHEPWHAGYTPYWGDVNGNQIPDIYYKFIPSAQITCVQYATNGCWQVQVITRNGCDDLSGELGVLNSKNTQVETLYGSTGAVSAYSRAVLEFDADSGSAAGENGQITSLTCY